MTDSSTMAELVRAFQPKQKKKRRSSSKRQTRTRWWEQTSTATKHLRVGERKEKRQLSDLLRIFKDTGISDTQAASAAHELLSLLGGMLDRFECVDDYTNCCTEDAQTNCSSEDSHSTRNHLRLDF
ncbi:MAG: hypothetical protein MHM6MM_006473 [Cercozoa sp. M6MM]